MTKLFVTGATGYIGGDAVYAIAHARPELEVTALVRNSDKGAKIAAQYPDFRLVYGGLDDTDLLTTEALKADIVLHCADADHVGAAKALVAGLGKKADGQFGYLIHTSGTGMLSHADYERKSYGIKDEKIFDDWDNVKEVVNMADDAIHRNVDKIVLAAGTEYPGKVYSAVVAPPCINGPGRGPDNQDSMQVIFMTRAVLKRGKGLQVAQGNNLWADVHVQDLSNVFLGLVEDAMSGGKRATWGPEAYYFAMKEEFVWGDVAKAIAKIAHDKKLIKTAEIDRISTSEADELTPYGSYLWGMNSRCRSIRAKKLLNWEPKQKSLFEMLPDVIDKEARALGLTVGHATEAAG